MKYLAAIFIILFSNLIFAEEYSKEQFREAFTFHRNQADSGNAESMFFLYQAYLNGWGTSSNKKIAIRWLDKAIELNQPFALSEMGRKYLMGDGVEQNTSEAIKYVDLALAENFIDAAVMLGSQFLGVQENEELRDIPKAKKYLGIASEANHPDGLFYLGLLYHQRLDPNIDISTDKYLDMAVKFYKKSAELGHFFAAGNLGVILQDEFYPKRNLEQSYYWLNVAKLSGQDTYNNAYYNVELKLSSPQKNRVKENVRKLVESYKKTSNPTP